MVRLVRTFFQGIAVSSLAFSASLYSDEAIEEIVVKGKVLYSDQVKALKTPTAIIDVPQSLSIFTDADIRKQGIREIGDIVRYLSLIHISEPTRPY